MDRLRFKKPKDEKETGNKTSSDLSTSSALIKFYRGNGTDFGGRYLKDIMKWDMRKLEQDHAYIQTMFPLPESSNIVGRSAPKIDYEVFKAFRKSPNLRRALYNSFRRILWFYGLRPKLNEEGYFETVEKNPDSWHNSTRSWNAQFDHNHLRITRIIRCLRVLGLEEEAQAFYEFLKENAVRASKTSHMYWTRAAKRPLNVKPDIDINEDTYHIVGDAFLKAYEKRLKEAEEKDKEYGKGNWTKTEEEEAEDEENWSQSEDEDLV